MIFSTLPISKTIVGIGAAGVIGVSAVGVGIYKLVSYVSENKNTPRCRVFFVNGEENEEVFTETNLNELGGKDYSNKTDLINDVKVACESTNLTEKPHYKWRVYIREGKNGDQGKGIYAKDDQKKYGEIHNSSIR